MKTSQTIHLEDVTIDILGTAHISAQSREQVRQALAVGNYDLVAVELCPKRHQNLANNQEFLQQDLENIIRRREVVSSAIMLALSGYQKSLSEDLGVELGGEFVEAINYTKKTDTPLALVDRNADITLKRLFSKLSWWRKALLMTSFIGGFFYREKLTPKEIENLKDQDTIEGMLKDMPCGTPTLLEVILTERDDYMALKLLEKIRQKGAKSVFLIVGLAHKKGICKLLTHYGLSPQNTTSRITDYEKIPKASWFSRMFPWFIMLIIVTGFILGFHKDTGLGIEMLEYWVLINGGLASLGAVLSCAHPMTIITVFLAAPLTSLNPAIGVGMVAILVELYLRKPKMADFDALRKDVASLSGWRRNRIARALLTAFACTIGSIIGTYLGGGYILSALH